MAKPFTVVDGTIILHRDFTELDSFVKQFLDVLAKHSDYLIVSGYVSIVTGRTRATEDVDVLIPIMSQKAFAALFNDLGKNGFWCYQADTASRAYSHIREKLHIRFARAHEMFPNIEFVPIDETKKLQYFEFSHPQEMRVRDFTFKVPPLEFEILYKEKVLGSPKDLADAKHLRTLFSELLSEQKFKEFKALIEHAK